MATLEIDRMEYSTDALARAAYVTSSSANLTAYSEATIKTQGSYSLKGMATTSASGAVLEHTLPTASDLTDVDYLKFDIRSNRPGETIKLGLCYGEYFAPSGGVISTDGDYTVHQFLTSGTFYTPRPLSAEVLIVAGGGGGSGAPNGGGGGAGGLLHYDVLSIAASSFIVTVGAGGGASLNGGNSIFKSLTATGGGGGGYYFAVAKAGGSGGGSCYGSSGGAGVSGQGTAGGAGSSATGQPAGGGGGAALSGSSGVAGVPSRGGDGLPFSITGTTKYYAGGGGGSFQSPAIPLSAVAYGGLGGGGNGIGGYGGTPGTPNTGGGGGGTNAGTVSGVGGSGIVIIRYATPVVTTVTEITPNIVVADQFQTVNWNLKNIDNADKDLIECLKVEIVEATSANTFYLDDVAIAQAIDVVGVID